MRLGKRFARSKRRIVRLWRTTEAQSEAAFGTPGRPFGLSRMTALHSKKWRGDFFDTQKSPQRDCFSPRYVICCPTVRSEKPPRRYTKDDLGDKTTC